jgi:hypothetical protein
LLTSVIALATLLATSGAALAAPAQDFGLAPADLSLMPRDLDYPDTECGCAPAPKLLHPDFGLNEGGVDQTRLDAGAPGPDLALADAALPDAAPVDGGGDLGQPSAELPWGCQLGGGDSTAPLLSVLLLFVLGRVRAQGRRAPE